MEFLTQPLPEISVGIYIFILVSVFSLGFFVGLFGLLKK